MDIIVRYFGQDPDDGLPYVYVEHWSASDSGVAKPTDASVHGHLVAGWSFEPDTGKVYAYDATAQEWVEQTALQMQN